MTNFNIKGSQQIDISMYKRPGQHNEAANPTFKRQCSVSSLISGNTSMNDDLTSCAGISETRIANDFRVDEIAEAEESIGAKSQHSSRKSSISIGKIKN